MKAQAMLTSPQSESQISWGGNDDPNGLFEEGKYYECEIEVRSSSTALYFINFPGKKFNSVNFKFFPEDAWDQAATKWRSEYSKGGPRDYKTKVNGVYI